MEGKFSILLFIITIIDLYFNYKANEFPDYHKARIYSDIFSLLAILFPFILMLFICCNAILLFTECINNNMVEKCTFIMTIFFVLMVIVFAFISSVIQIYSIYLYFEYDGSSKINKIIIKILMWISLISIIIKIFFGICDFISSLKNKNEKNEEMIELEVKEQDKI